MTRDEMISKLMWNNGGGSYGICTVGSMFAIACAPKQTLPSCVAVGGPADKYTDEELTKLVQFSENSTANHIKSVGSVLYGDNLTIIDKIDECRWLRKRISWEMGPMFSNTLDDAIAFMSK